MSKKTRQEKLEEALTVLKEKYDYNEKDKTNHKLDKNKPGQDFVFCILKYYYGGKKYELDLNSKKAFTNALIDYLLQNKFLEKYERLEFLSDNSLSWISHETKMLYAKEMALQLSYLEYEPLVDREILE